MMPTDEGDNEQQQHAVKNGGSSKAKKDEAFFKRQLSNGGRSPDGSGTVNTKRQRKTSKVAKKIVQ